MKCIYVIFFTLRQLSINTKYILAGLDNYNQLRMQWFPYDHTADVISPSSARFQISGQQVQENHDFPNIENSQQTKIYY